MVNIRSQFQYWVVAAVFAAGQILCPAQTPSAANPPAFSEPDDAGLANPESSLSLPADNTLDRPMRGPNSFARQALPTPTPDINLAQQKLQREQSDWTLLTPEEIMGLQTPEQMFGLPEDDQDLSPEERYLKRQEKAKTAAAETGLSAPGAFTHEFTGRFDRPDSEDSTLASEDQDDPGAFSRMFKDADVSPFSPNKNALSGVKAAANAAQTEKVNQEEAAEMDRFRKLIGEVPAIPDATLALPHPPTEPGLQPGSAWDPFGHPALPHSVDLSKPSGLTLPPDIVGSYTAPPRKIKKPSWEPQSPPWLSDDLSAPNKPPVRKFY